MHVLKQYLCTTVRKVHSTSICGGREMNHKKGNGSSSATRTFVVYIYIYIQTTTTANTWCHLESVHDSNLPSLLHFSASSPEYNMPADIINRYDHHRSYPIRNKRSVPNSMKSAVGTIRIEWKNKNFKSNYPILLQRSD